MTASLRNYHNRLNAKAHLCVNWLILMLSIGVKAKLMSQIKKSGLKAKLPQALIIVSI